MYIYIYLHLRFLLNHIHSHSPLLVEGKNWKNLWSTSSYNFPSSQLPSSFGEASLLMDTYHFTALDESTNVSCPWVCR